MIYLEQYFVIIHKILVGLKIPLSRKVMGKNYKKLNIEVFAKLGEITSKI